MGKILAICTSPRRGTVKTAVPSAVLTPEWGIVGDAHGGNWHRQVSMLSAEKIEAFRKKVWVDYGAFGENLVVEGFDFRTLPVTSRFAIGDVVLEMTQIGKECHNGCVIKQIHVGGFGGDNEIAQVRKTDFPKIRARQPKYRRGYCRKRKAMAFHDIQYVQIFHSFLWNCIDTRSEGERIKKRHYGDIECQFEHL